MIPVLRDYQKQLVTDVRSAWAAGARNVLAVLPTGAGKTLVVGDIIASHQGASVLIAHRSELVSQASLMLARFGIRHDIIGSANTRRAIAAAHVAKLGRCFYSPGERCVVASVDTLVRRKDLGSWANQVTLWVVDEAHHATAAGVDPITGAKQGNKWYRAVQMFTHPNALGLGPTATPRRADGRGLGAHTDGLMHVMLEGPSTRELIDDGYLSDYRVWCPESDLQVLAEVSASGDWSPFELRKASQRSHIIGDVVKSYREYADGLLNLTFTTDVETAQQMALSYRGAGISAMALTGDTDPRIRRQTLQQFERRQIMVIVAVDIVGEGTDLPACESITEARPTQSLAVWMQHWGRGMRPMYASGYNLSVRSGRRAAIAAGPKPYAIFIDHTGGFVNPALGPPDRPRIWSLDRRDRRSRGASDAIPLRICLECFQPFERIHKACPYCNAPIPAPTARSSPAHVEGDLAELDPTVLAQLRGEATLHSLEDERARLQRTGLPDLMVRANVKRYGERIDTQARLREAMALWAGPYHAAGETDNMIQRRFWHSYGCSVVEAMGLAASDAEALRLRLDGSVREG